MPSLETLRIFEACARHGNFSRAAGELCITPAAVSQRIRALETDLGRSLFVRNGPRIALSGDGETLFRRTGQMMAIARAAVEELRAVRKLRVTATPSFASRWLAARLPDFAARHPGIEVEIDVSAEVRHAWAFDVAIRSGPGDWPGLRATPLFPVEGTPMLHPALAEGRALAAPEDLAGLPFIASGDWPRWFAAQGARLPEPDAGRRSAYPTQDLAAQAALEGKGVALLSPRLFAADLTAGRLVAPFPFVLSGPERYWLVERGTPDAAAAAFRDWLLAGL